MRWAERLRGDRHDVPYEGRRVCVTGGAGFIGGHLAEALFELGAHVTIIDDLSSSDSLVAAALVDKDPARVRLIVGSILDPEALSQAVEDAQVVFHLAAVASVTASLEDPERSYLVNATGTLRVAEAARLAGAKRLVYSASSSAYGDLEPPGREDLAVRPLTPYAAGKASGEHIVTAWSRSGGLPGVGLRLFNVYGPRQPADGPYAAVIPALAKRLCAGEPAVIYGDGSQTRDFVHVTDAVRAFLLAGATARDPRGAIVNIGSGRAVTVLEVERLVARAFDRQSLKPRFEPARPGDVAYSLADTSKARELLGFTAGVTLEEGLGSALETLCGDHNANA